MANSSMKQRIEFPELPKLPPPLAAHQTFQFLYDKVSAIDAEILGAKSRKRKLKIITQTAAVDLTCLRVAKAIALTEETRNPHYKKAWIKALVNIVDRAKDVMQRENVKENFSHYQPPRVLRVLIESGQHYSTKLRERARTVGIMAKDEEDLRFALDHWRLIVLEMESESHEDIIRLTECESNVAWIESTLAVAMADRETMA